jgi:WD40 repeat protein
VWQLEPTAGTATRVAQVDATAACLATSHDGRLVAIASESGTITLLDAGTFEVAATLRGGPSVVALTFSANDERLAGVSLDGDAWLWTLGSSRVTAVETTLLNATAVAFDESGRWLAIGGDGPIIVRPLPVPTEPAALQEWVARATDLVLTPGQIGDTPREEHP